jgi:PKD repeat protein
MRKKKVDLITSAITQVSPASLFKEGDSVLCNLILSFQDPFNPLATKGTVVSTFSAKNQDWARVDWGGGYISMYRVDKGELIPYSDDVLKQRKADAKKAKS